MNTVSCKVRGFAHHGFVAVDNVLIFQNLSHVPNQRDRGLASPDKHLAAFVDVPFEDKGGVHFREQTLYRGLGTPLSHGAKIELENSGMVTVGWSVVAWSFEK